MKKLLIGVFFTLAITCLTGCSYFDEVNNTIDNALKPNVTCSVDKQYLDDYGFSYYIEGTCTNNGTTDYNYLQVEFICYDGDGNNLGTALDNTNNLLAGQTWKFKAMDLVSDSESIDHCDYHEVTGW